MCENCVEIDKKIANYQRLTSRFTDQAMLDGTKVLIERATAESRTSPGGTEQGRPLCGLFY
jgi:hypothetical protein